MKNILVDLYKIKNYFSGLGQFSLNFARELVKQAPDDWYIDFLIPPNSSVDLPDGNYGFVKTNYQYRYLPFLTKKYDLWHSLNQFPSHGPSSGSRQILTVHDLNFLIEKSGGKREKYLRSLKQNIEKADFITTISEYSKSEIEKHIDLQGKEVKVIYNGVSFGADESSKPSFVKTDKFFFSIGIFNPKKNFESLIPLMQHFEDHQLIIAGNHDNHYGIEIQDQVRKLKLSDRIILPGKISDKDKNWLYKNAVAMLFPSLAEGFGLPVIEAMHFGCPVFLSRHTALPEIGGKEAFYFDDFEVLNMVDAVRKGISEFNRSPLDFKERLYEHANRFTWEKSMASYIELYKEVLG